MANYVASARTNYFDVKSAKAFENEMAGVNGVEVITNLSGQYGLLCDDDDGAGWPSCQYNEETGEEDEIDLFEIVSKHLTKDAVAIFQEVGAEKLRYITGYSIAINAEGKSIQISLEDIYDKAKTLTTNPKKITRASY